MPHIELSETDITRLPVDAIVNAANTRLLGGGGVDGAIHRAAGPRLLEACRDLPANEADIRCPTGGVRITPGFELPARWVIHTVGPIWHGGNEGEAELLASCYRRSLQLAQAYGLDSVAFPAISCGVYGYPIEAAARIAVTSIREFAAPEADVARVVLCAHGEGVAGALRRALAAA